MRSLSIFIVALLFLATSSHAIPKDDIGHEKKEDKKEKKRIKKLVVPSSPEKEKSLHQNEKDLKKLRGGISKLSSSTQLQDADFCKSWNQWEDSVGDGCDTYDDYFCSRAEVYEKDNVSALSACCECGGGLKCYNNDAYWNDSDGDDCSYYTNKRRCSTAERYRHHGKSAKDLCCECGGGEWQQVDSSTVSSPQ